MCQVKPNSTINEIIFQQCSVSFATRFAQNANNFNVKKISLKSKSIYHEKLTGILLPGTLADVYPKLEELKLIRVELEIQQAKDQLWPEQLTTLEIDNSVIASLPQIESSNIQTLKLKRIPNENFESLSLANFTYLKHLDIHQCTEFTKISEGLLRNLKCLQHLELQGNGLNQLDPHCFEDLTNVTELDLADNELVIVDERSFKGLINLHTIDLKNNEELSIGQKAFSGTPHLANIISSNIKQIDAKVFETEQLANVISLDLHNVSTLSEQTLQYLIRGMTNLEKLNVEHNNVEITNFKPFLAMKKLKYLKLLHGNSFQEDDCHTASAMLSLKTSLRLSQAIMTHLQKVHQNCQNQITVLILGIAISLTVLFVLSIFAIRQFRYWFYNSKMFSKLFFYDQNEAEDLIENGANVEKSFDAFLTYAEADREIMETIKNGLVGGYKHRRFHVATHENDFIPGNTIENNMRMCMARSKRCIALVSTHYLNSSYCQHELLLMTGSENVKKLIVVLLDKNIRDQLAVTDPLYQYFKTHTFLGKKLKSYT